MVETDLTCPVVRDPDKAGVGTEHPDLAQIEGAHLLANQARPFLQGCGFTDGQVLHWALTFIARKGSGDVHSFVAWIRAFDPCSDLE